METPNDKLINISTNLKQNEIYIHPIHADYYIFQVGYTKRLCNNKNLRKLYKNVGLGDNDYDSNDPIKILYINYSKYHHIPTEDSSVLTNHTYWNCHFENKDDVEWIKHPESEKIHKILNDKIGENEFIPMDDCIVIKDTSFDENDIDTFHDRLDNNELKRKFEENILLCEHCGCFPNVHEEIDFTIEVDGKTKRVKYYQHDTESG